MTFTKEHSFLPGPLYWETHGIISLINTLTLINHCYSRAILHDESIYEDPETFNPDRFMKDGQLDPDIRPPETAVFGFGRR
jgi:hypothetical protein